jgi:hypothetical protein
VFAAMLLLVVAAKRKNALGRCGASITHKTKLEQSILFRYLWSFCRMMVGQKYFNLKTQNEMLSSKRIIMSQMANEDISAAGFCCQVAAWVTIMFCIFLFDEKSQNSHQLNRHQSERKNMHRLRIHTILGIFKCVLH